MSQFHADYIEDVKTVYILTSLPTSEWGEEEWDEVAFQHRLRKVIQTGEYDPEQDEGFLMKPQVVQERYLELKRMAGLKG